MKQIFELLGQWNSITILVIVLSFIFLLIAKRKGIMFYIKEYINIYSEKESLFGKKRVESGEAFKFAMIMTMIYFYKKVDTMDIWDFGYILGVWLFVAGYTINQIQKEKKSNLSDKPDNKLDEAAK